jgi:hypothetical protein
MVANTRLLELALKGLKAERDRITREIDELTARLNGARPAQPAKKRGARKKRRLSTAQRQAISKRMKATWAERRAKKKR